MKVIQLCIRVPYPPRDGATIAMYNISKALLQQQVDLDMLSFNTNKSFVSVHEINREFADAVSIQTVDLNLEINPLDAFLNLFSTNSFHIERFRSAEFESVLINKLRQTAYDIVLFEGLYMSPYHGIVKHYSKAKTILRSHNIEFVIWERLAAACTNPLKKWYLNLLANRLKQYELSMLNSFNAILPITPVDELHYERLGSTVPKLTIPIGVNVSDYEIHPVGEFSLFHLGSMNWMPNLEAVDWFLEKVYPIIRNKDPQIRIYLAGKDMPERIFDRHDDLLKVEGQISDSKKYMKDKAVMMVPLLSGGGMRVKIIEGMAAGKAIISTAVGAEGIEYTHGKNILIADTPQEFAEEILRLKQDPQLLNQLGLNARKLVEQCYDNAVLGKRLTGFIQNITGN